MVHSFFQKLKNFFTPERKNPYDNKIEIMGGSIVSGDSTIGDYTYIGFNCIITKSVIGRYCSIANNVSIGVGEHKLKRVSTSSLFYQKPYETLTEKECTLGNDVWVGSNVVIRRGVSIGDGAVIGANSFVNKSVDKYAIVAGVPARIIGTRFSDFEIQLIENSKWWSHDLADASEIINHLNSIAKFEKDED